MESFRNLVDLCERSCRRHAARPLFGTRSPQGWAWLSYGEFAHQVGNARAGLVTRGVGAGDRVAIVSNNRVEWAVTAYAAYGLGATVVPLYESQRPEEWKFILADCAAKLAVASTPAIRDRLLGFRGDLPALGHVVGMDLPADDPDSFTRLLATGETSAVAAADPPPEQVASFVYTSGTTGKPKGVILTHGNVASNVSAVHAMFVLDPEDRSLSILPWAHSFGQTCELHNLLSMGCSIAINDDVGHIVKNLAEVRPTVLLAVPLVFHRIHHGVQRQMAGHNPAIRWLFEQGLREATKRLREESSGLAGALLLAIADRLLFSRIRARFGGRLKYAISGSAALGPAVAQFLDALGITVYEGYGLTETSPIVSANYPGSRKPGSVGRPIPGVRVEIRKVDDSTGIDGEIIVYGPNVMRGYYNRPGENERVFTPDGGLRTGDLGYLDEESFLHVTGRIKELYKLENGKYVMPAVLEETIKLSPFVANVMVYGANRPWNVALVAPDREAIAAWAKERGLSLDDPARDPRVRELLRNEIARLETGFRAFERIRAFEVLDEEFSIDDGSLTPTFKLRRAVLVERHRAILDGLYAARGEAVGATA